MVTTKQKSIRDPNIKLEIVINSQRKRAKEKERNKKEL